MEKIVFISASFLMWLWVEHENRNWSKSFVFFACAISGLIVGTVVLTLFQAALSLPFLHPDIMPWTLLIMSSIGIGFGIWNWITAGRRQFSTQLLGGLCGSFAAWTTGSFLVTYLQL
jgi:protein-S-isoprenylcysteine O-methyltransferase Ste14